MNSFQAIFAVEFAIAIVAFALFSWMDWRARSRVSFASIRRELDQINDRLFELSREQSELAGDLIALTDYEEDEEANADDSGVWSSQLN